MGTRTMKCFVLIMLALALTCAAAFDEPPTLPPYLIGKFLRNLTRDSGFTQQQQTSFQADFQSGLSRSMSYWIQHGYSGSTDRLTLCNGTAQTFGGTQFGKEKGCERGDAAELELECSTIGIGTIPKVGFLSSSSFDGSPAISYSIKLFGVSITGYFDPTT